MGIRKKRYLLIWLILFCISIIIGNSIQLKFSKLFLDGILFSIIYFLFSPISSFLQTKINNRKKVHNLTINSTLFLNLHKYNILFALCSLGYFNIIHYHSWSGLFIRLLIGFILLIILELVLKNYKINIIKLKKLILNFFDLINNDSEQTKQKNTILPFILGLILVICGLFYLEIFIQKYYFIQDDNYSQFFPVILGAMRDVFEKGIFPEINPYQFTGIPTTSASVYALTYPVIYFSYWFSRFILRDEFYTIDVFAWIHIITAYILSYKAAKYCKVNSTLSTLFAICYSLSGYSLIGIRSWYYMAPITAFAPMIVIGLEFVKNQIINTKFIIIGSIITALLIYAGNIQMFMYASMFYILGLLILFYVHSINGKKVIKSLYPVIIGGILALPQIYVTLDLMKDINRIPWQTLSSTYVDFITFFIPTYLLKMLNIVNPLFWKFMGNGFYSGTIFFTTAFFVLLACIIFYIFSKNNHRQILLEKNLYLFIGGFALILSLGYMGGVWTLLHSFPIFNKFINSQKFIIFINLFFNLGGVIVLSRINKFSKIITTLIIILMLFHIKYAISAFYVYPSIKYMNVNNIKDIKNFRIYSYSPKRTVDKEYSLTFSMNIPTINSIHSIDAYNDRLEILLKDSLFLYKKIHLENSSFPSEVYLDTNFLRYLNEYGVKYFIYMDIEKYDYWPEYNMFDKKQNELIINYVKKNFSLAYNYKNKIKFYQIPNPKPLAFDEKIKSIPIKFNTQGVIVDLANVSTPQKVTINMIKRKYYKAFVDGVQAKIITDNYNRMVIEIQKPAKVLVVKYHSPWEKGLLLSVIGFILFVISTFLLEKAWKNQTQKNN